MKRIFYLFLLAQLIVPLISKGADDTEILKIGVVTSNVPAAKDRSDSIKAGLERAKTEINQSGGINGKQIRLIFSDDAADPKKAVAAYKNLVYKHKVKFIFGPQFEDTLAAVLPISKNGRQLLFITSTSVPGNKSKFPWVIHSYPSHKSAAKCLANVIKDDERSRTMFLVPRTLYSQAFSQALRGDIKQSNPMLLTYEPGKTSAEELMLKIERYKPDSLVYLFDSIDSAIENAKAISTHKLTLPIYSTDLFHRSKRFVVEADKAANGFTYCAIPRSERDSKIKSFLEGLEQTPKSPLHTVIAYDTLRWLAVIMKSYGEDVAQVKEAIYQLEYPGIFTTYSFDEWGDLKYNKYTPYIIENGQYEKKVEEPERKPNQFGVLPRKKKEKTDEPESSKR